VLGVIEGSPVILRNDGTKNHWLGVALTGGAGSNREGLGARVTLIDSTGRRQVMEVTSAGSYLSSSDRRIIFGLGVATSVRSVEVLWPGGATQRISNPTIDRYHAVNERDTKK
jgi:enediyne biosynthesis protein E4